MNKFKVGDKVKLNKDVSYTINRFLKNKFGEGYKDKIYEIATVTDYAVTVEGCNYWCFAFDNFVKYEEGLKVGDLITLKEKDISESSLNTLKSIFGENYMLKVFKVLRTYKDGDTDRIILYGYNDISFKQNLFEKYTPKFKEGEHITLTSFPERGRVLQGLGYQAGESIYLTVGEPKYKGFTTVKNKDNDLQKLINDKLIKYSLATKKEYNILDTVRFKVSENNTVTCCTVIDTKTKNEAKGRACVKPTDKFDKRYGYIISLCRALNLEESKVKGIINVLYNESISKEDVDKVFSKVLDELLNK